MWLWGKRVLFVYLAWRVKYQCYSLCICLSVTMPACSTRQYKLPMNRVILQRAALGVLANRIQSRRRCQFSPFTSWVVGVPGGTIQQIPSSSWVFFFFSAGCRTTLYRFYGNVRLASTEFNQADIPVSVAGTAN